jgi:hyperosmotically inducible periplasmic protein
MSTPYKEAEMKAFLSACAIAGILVTGSAPVTAEQHGGASADNTERNVRDRDDKTLTPTDQGGSAADRDVTAAIRKAIVDNDSLSTNAQNVKIVTVAGVVTLRGPVETPAEKAAIAETAEKTKGVKRVDNQLEIKNP